MDQPDYPYRTTFKFNLTLKRLAPNLVIESVNVDYYLGKMKTLYYYDFVSILTVLLCS
jgi:hypothetical protein